MCGGDVEHRRREWNKREEEWEKEGERCCKGRKEENER